MELTSRNFDVSTSNRDQWNFRAHNSGFTPRNLQNSLNLDTSIARRNVTQTQFSCLSQTFDSQTRRETQEVIQVPSEVLWELCTSLQQCRTNVNSSVFEMNKTEFLRVQTAAQYFQDKHRPVHRTSWSIECGQSSSSALELQDAVSERLVYHIFSKTGRVLGKFEVRRPLQKLIVNKIQRQKSPIQLKDLDQLSPLEIKELYKAPRNYFKLGEIKNEHARVNTIGVVTSVNKLPTKGKSSWHSFLCISDPSLLGNSNDEAPSEFKMHIYLPFFPDFPKIHRGDVIRFTNVKVEVHQNRNDGRIFTTDDWKVYCCWEDDTVLDESNEEFSTTVRILSKWWRVNDRFFDYVTPHPIYQDTYRYPGVRMLKEASDNLVFDLYCQVISLSDESDDYNWFSVQDGTIFTLQDRCASAGSKRARDETAGLPTFGYMALVVLNADQWRQLQSMKVGVGDYLLLHQVCATFISDDTMQQADTYPFKYPCILLRIQPSGVSEVIEKIPARHHEAAKMRRRLHHLPDALDQVRSWTFPESDEVAEQSAHELTEPPVQLRILKRLKPL